MEAAITFPEVISLFFILLGFIFGIGSVTVIDIHSFLARDSAYWTEATTRTHKVTKPLIWTGLICLIVGLGFYHVFFGFNSFFIIKAVLIAILFINGLFLTFYVSPFLLKRECEGCASDLLPKFMKKKIKVSFILSFIAWWTVLLVQILDFAVKM